MGLDTFATAVYVIVDDILQARGPRPKPGRGRPPLLTDSEMIAVLLLIQWCGRGSEREGLGWAQRRLTAFFPNLPLVRQNAFNPRARSLEATLTRIVGVVAQRMEALEGGWEYEAIDTTAMPLMSIPRGERGRLFGSEAAVGRGGTNRVWRYGMKLCAVVGPSGCVSGYAAGPANTEDRWLAEGVLSWRNDPAAGQPSPERLQDVLGQAHRNHGARIGPTGPAWPPEGAGRQLGELYLADKGFRGRMWQAHWREHYESLVMTPKSPGCPSDLNPKRQIVETVFHLLIDRLSLRNLRARSFAGVRTRVAAKLAALNIGILINRLFHLAPLTLFNPTA